MPRAWRGPSSAETARKNRHSTPVAAPQQRGRVFEGSNTSRGRCQESSNVGDRRVSWPVAGGLQAVLAQLVGEVAARDAEGSRGLGLLAARARERADDQVALEPSLMCAQVHALREALDPGVARIDAGDDAPAAACPGRAPGRRSPRGASSRPRRQDARAFDGVAEFADVARESRTRPGARGRRRRDRLARRLQLEARSSVRKRSTSAGISSRRSRSGGMAIGTTARR